jgi:hypothetical protein
MMRLIQSNEWLNGNVSGLIGFAPYNPKVRVPEEIITEMETFLLDLTNGTIQTEVSPNAP